MLRDSGVTDGEQEDKLPSWQAKCKNWPPFSWHFDIKHFLVFSTLLFIFFIFQGVSGFLNYYIYDIRIHYHFLNFFLSVGKWPPCGGPLQLIFAPLAQTSGNATA